MEKIKVRKVLPIIASLLAIPFIISGCAQRSDCDVKKQHVHLYKISDVNGVFYTYLDNEALEFFLGRGPQAGRDPFGGRPDLGEKLQQALHDVSKRRAIGNGSVRDRDRRRRAHSQRIRPRARKRYGADSA